MVSGNLWFVSMVNGDLAKKKKIMRQLKKGYLIILKYVFLLASFNLYCFFFFYFFLKLLSQQPNQQKPPGFELASFFF